MPKGPKGEKRPADVIGNAVHVMRIGTGEIEEGAPVNAGKDPTAKALGKRGSAARAAKRWRRDRQLCICTLYFLGRTRHNALPVTPTKALVS